MSMVMKSNIPAVRIAGTMNRNVSAVSKSLQRISNGMKIDSAADDNAGWSISERMRTRVRGLDQADRNTQNGRSLLKVAEGAVQSTVEILRMLKEKAISAANDSNTDADRLTIQKELNQFIDQIDDNANVTYNGVSLIDGSKNTLGSATYTALTNQRLATDTLATTKLLDLKTRDGANLGLLETDKITVSYVQGGKTYSGTFDVTRSAEVKTILQVAEDIDRGSFIFADRYNRSVASVNNEANLDETRAKAAAARSLSEDTNAKLIQAKTWRDGYYAAIGAAESALEGLTGAVKSYDIVAAASLCPEYDVRRQDASFFSEEGFPDPGHLRTTAINAVFTKVGEMETRLADALTAGDITERDACQAWFSSSIGRASVALVQRYNAYQGAYDAIDQYKADHDLSGTGLWAEPSDLIASEYNAVRPVLTTPGTYDEYVESARMDDDAALLYLRTYSEPIILESNKIGLQKSGGLLETADGQNALTITAMTSGIAGQISGFTIYVTDREGNIRSSVNSYLDAFTESIRAENESEDNSVTIHVGAEPSVAIKVAMTDMRSEALGLKGADGVKLDISTQARANAAISVLNNAIHKVLNQQADIGNIVNRLEYTAANLRVASDNVQASESTIRDADMAKEMTEYAKHNVLLSASQSMLSQANQNSIDVMTLLR